MPSQRTGLSKYEKRGITRQQARAWRGKLPLMEPLHIAPAGERAEALKRGRMVFYDRGDKIEVALCKADRNLQGLYKTHDGRLITLRSWVMPGVLDTSYIDFGELDKSGGFKERWGPVASFVSKDIDLGHMELESRLRGQGLGLKAASKAERHVRSRKRGEHEFSALNMFRPIFKKLGYSIVKDMPFVVRLRKQGKHRAADDLDRFHRIEAIDPRTKKAKIFTFPAQEITFRE